MIAPLPTLFREAHRLRRHLRELQAEIDDSPRKIRIRNNRIAKLEDELKQAQETIKHLKTNIATLDLNLKSSHQQLLKYQQQLGDMKNERETVAKQAEIDFTQSQIRELEEQSLAKIAELDTRTADLPRLNENLAKAKEEFKVFEKETNKAIERLREEKAHAEIALLEAEKDLPETIRSDYDRVVKAHGADALSGVKDRVCEHCNNSITVQQKCDLLRGMFLCCRTCGRGLYPIV